MGRSKGSWTFEEMHRVIMEWPNDTPILEPLSEKVERSLSSAIPFDLYPFAVELISLDGFISKKLALNLLTFLLIDRENWKVDPDKILSLRRVRVTRFCAEVQKYAQPGITGTDLITVSGIMDRVERLSFWNMEKGQVSKSVLFISNRTACPVFATFDALVRMNRDGFDVAAALHSIIEHIRQTEPEPLKQLSLL